MTRELSCSNYSCVESLDPGHGSDTAGTLAIGHLRVTLLTQCSLRSAWASRSLRRLTG